MESIAPRRKRLTNNERREDLLDVAARTLLDLGYEAMTMDIVTERAGVSRGLLYSHFGSLDELLFGVYLRECAKLDVWIGELLKNAVTFDDKVRAIVRAYYEFEHAPNALLAQLNLCMTHRWFTSWGRRDRLDLVGRRWAEIISDEFDVAPEISALLARAAAASTDMIVTAWHKGAVPRGIAESLAVDYLLSGLAAAAGARQCLASDVVTPIRRHAG